MQHTFDIPHAFEYCCKCLNQKNGNNNREIEKFQFEA